MQHKKYTKNLGVCEAHSKKNDIARNDAVPYFRYSSMNSSISSNEKRTTSRKHTMMAQMSWMLLKSHLLPQKSEVRRGSTKIISQVNPWQTPFLAKAMKCSTKSYKGNFSTEKNIVQLQRRRCSSRWDIKRKSGTFW